MSLPTFTNPTYLPLTRMRVKPMAPSLPSIASCARKGSYRPRVNFSHPLPDHHLNLSDHLPIITSFRIHHNPPQIPSSVSKSTPSFTPRSWNSVSEEAVCSLYSTPLQRLGDMLSNLQPTIILSQTPLSYRSPSDYANRNTSHHLQKHSSESISPFQASWVEPHLKSSEQKV